MNIILKKPLITETSMKLVKSGFFTFLVDKKARKPEIARAVRNKFGVDVVAVNTANFKSQTKTQRGKRGYFVVQGFKKAIVKLKPGQNIPLFEAGAKQEPEVEGQTKEKKEIKVKEKKSLLKGTKVRIEKKEKE